MPVTARAVEGEDSVSTVSLPNWIKTVFCNGVHLIQLFSTPNYTNGEDKYQKFENNLH